MLAEHLRGLAAGALPRSYLRPGWVRLCLVTLAQSAWTRVLYVQVVRAATKGASARLCDGCRAPATALFAGTVGYSMMLVNVHGDQGSVAEKTGRRVYIAFWKFRIGQLVTLGMQRGIVIGRRRTAIGLELYHVWVTGMPHGEPMRWLAARVLE